MRSEKEIREMLDSCIKAQPQGKPYSKDDLNIELCGSCCEECTTYKVLEWVLDIPGE